MRKMLFVVLLLVVVAVGCTDATRGKLKALGDSALVSCYSGGKLIYEGQSTGKVRSEENSDGYFFVDKKTGLPMEVSGDCIIVYNDE